MAVVVDDEDDEDDAEEEVLVLVLEVLVVLEVLEVVTAEGDDDGIEGVNCAGKRTGETRSEKLAMGILRCSSEFGKGLR